VTRVFVFVLTRSYDMECESPIGVFASEQSAKRAAEKDKEQSGYDDRDEWHADPHGNQVPNVLGGVSYIIRKEPVQT
jgi:hypothetical protein